MGTIWSAVGIWGRRLIGFVVFVILARHVSPESLGLASLAMVCIAFMELLSRQGIGMALVQRKDINPSILNTAFSMNMLTAAVMVLLCNIFAENIAVAMGNARLENVIRVLSVIIFASASNVVPVALQSRNFDFKSMTVQTFLGTAASAIVAIPLAIAGFEVWALVVQAIVFAIVNSLTIWLRTQWRPGLELYGREFWPLLSFSLKILLSNLINFVRNRFDQILLGIALGPAGLGLYMVGLKIGETVDSFIKGPIDQVALPAFSKIKNDPVMLTNAISRGMRLNALLSLPIFTGLAIVSREAIIIAFGEKWVAAALICSILALRQLAANLFFFNYHIFISQGYPGTYTMLQIFQTAGVIVSALIGKTWGAVGVGIGGLINVMVFNFIGTFILCKLLKVPHHKMYTPLVAPLVCTVAMATAIIFLQKFIAIHTDAPLVFVLWLLPAGFVVYTGSIRIFFPDLYKEVHAMAMSIRSKGKKETVENR